MELQGPLENETTITGNQEAENCQLTTSKAMRLLVPQMNENELTFQPV